MPIQTYNSFNELAANTARVPLVGGMSLFNIASKDEAVHRATQLWSAYEPLEMRWGELDMDEEESPEGQSILAQMTRIETAFSKLHQEVDDYYEQKREQLDAEYVQKQEQLDEEYGELSSTLSEIGGALYY